MEIPIEKRLEMIDSSDSIPIAQQCEMVNIASSSYYDYKKEKCDKDNDIKTMINDIYFEHPEYGSRRITEILKRTGQNINRKRTQRLMQEMELQGIHPKKSLSISNELHKKYPYIARNEPIVRINQVWSTDITYIKTIFGYVYLVAIIDWHSRFVPSWKMSNSMSEEFCIDTLKDALKLATPEIFNSDQGSQFTGKNFIEILLEHNIRPSMDGKGRATDNAPVERFWRSVKWEDVYLYEPTTFLELQKQIDNYIKHYNYERPHQSINYKTPSEAYLDIDKKMIDSNYRFLYTERELDFMQKF